MEDAEPTATGAGGTDMSDIKKTLDFLGFAFNPGRQITWMYGDQKDNYRMHKAIGNSRVPIYSWISGPLASKMEDDEQLRYISDLAKNTGINPRNWKYPIRMGYYGNAGGLGSSLGSTNAGIMKLYKTSTRKPPKKEYNFYGNYYRYKNHYSR